MHTVTDEEHDALPLQTPGKLSWPLNADQVQQIQQKVGKGCPRTAVQESNMKEASTVSSERHKRVKADGYLRDTTGSSTANLKPDPLVSVPHSQGDISERSGQFSQENLSYDKENRAMAACKKEGPQTKSLPVSARVSPKIECSESYLANQPLEINLKTPLPRKCAREPISMPRSAVERPLHRRPAFRQIVFEDQAEQAQGIPLVEWQTQPYPLSDRNHFHPSSQAQTPQVAEGLHYQAEHLRHQLRAACEMLSFPLTADENGPGNEDSTNGSERKSHDRITQEFFDKELHTING